MYCEFQFNRFDDAQEAAMYLDDRGYEPRLMGFTVAVDAPVDSADVLVILSVFSGRYVCDEEPVNE